MTEQLRVALVVDWDETKPDPDLPKPGEQIARLGWDRRRGRAALTLRCVFAGMSPTWAVERILEDTVASGIAVGVTAATYGSKDPEARPVAARRGAACPL